MERKVDVGCYYRNQERTKTLEALVEAGFDANIVTGHGAGKLVSCGHLFETVPGERLIRGPGGTIYRGTSMVTAPIYPEPHGSRSEDERFYRVDREPPNLNCDLVLGQSSPTARKLHENGVAPTFVRRPRSDAEKQQQQDEDKKKDEQRRAEQEKKREKERRDREAKRGGSGR